MEFKTDRYEDGPKQVPEEANQSTQPYFGFALFLSALVGGLGTLAFSPLIGGLVVTAMIPVLLIANLLDPLPESPYTLLEQSRS